MLPNVQKAQKGLRSKVGSFRHCGSKPSRTIALKIAHTGLESWSQNHGAPGQVIHLNQMLHFHCCLINDKLAVVVVRRWWREVSGQKWRVIPTCLKNELMFWPEPVQRHHAADWQDQAAGEPTPIGSP